MIQHRVTQYIEKEGLFSSENKILVALSGGADSVALLCILHTAGYRCEAAHCNFHLRGEESNRDEQFVRQLCEKYKINLHTIDFDTTRYATEKHISIEMGARELRYNWFEKTRKDCQADVIAVAHHQDDSVETILLNLIRGTGITGLLGIRPRNGVVVRPLLCINREEIIHYLQSIQQEYVTDSTNLEDEYTRNKIRLNLLPLMQTINPSVKNNLIETSNYLNDVATLYNKYIEETKTKIITAEGGREEDRPQSRLSDCGADSQRAGLAFGNHRQRTGHPLALAGTADEKAQSERRTERGHHALHYDRAEKAGEK